MENTNGKQPMPAAIPGKSISPDISAQISQAIVSQSPKACLRLLSLLSQQTGNKQPDSENGKRLKVLAMPLLNANELPAIFSGSLATAFEYPVPDRLRVRLLSLPNDRRDAIKHQIEENLKANTQPFVAGTVINPAEWIARWMLADQSVAEYVKGDPDYQKLSNGDQLRVERLLFTFQLVSHSSATIEGIDEEIVMRDESGRLRVLKNGRVMDLNADRFEDNPPAVANVTFTPVVTPAIPIKPVVSSPKTPTAPSAVKLKPLKSLAPLSAIVTPPPIPVTTPTPAAGKPLAPKPSPILPAVVPAPADKSKFYFHEEDEADIARHRVKLAGEAATGPADFSHLISQLIKEYNIQLPDAQARSRFENIVTSRFQDVRDLIETKAMLGRSAKIGGVGLSADVVDQLVGKLEEQAKQVHAAEFAPPISLPTSAPIPTPAPKPLPTPKFIAPPPALPVVPEAPKIPPSPKPAAPAKPVPVTARPTITPVRPINPPPPVIKRPIDGIRPVVSDIKPPTRVMGPIDELANLSLDDYRRLGRNVAESNDKVMEKLELLEEESFLKRAAGIKAWKASPTHKLYLAIGRASMEKNLAVVDVIRQYQSNGQNSLTPQEFDAIADLNKRISY